MTLLEAAAALRARTVSSRELTVQCLQRIEKYNPLLNAFLTVTPERALQDADQADRELAAGKDRGPLHGIPIGLKDVYCTKGIRTTCGSPLFRDHVPDYDSAVGERLAAAGSVLLGKTHMHELAYGVTSNNAHFGAVRNPWNTDRVPGGSSGGSASAVSAGLCYMAMGSDTGGSIRVPAAFCNLTGLKPTHGRVSRYGVLPLDFSLDHMGPLTQTVRDTAVCLQVLAGADPRDESSSPVHIDEYLPPANASLKDLRIGVPANFYFERLQPGVSAAVRQMVQVAAGLGAKVQVVTVPDIAAMNVVSRVVLLAEAAAVMSHFEGRWDQISIEIRVLLEQGRLLSATDYVNAQRLRRQFRDEFLRLFGGIDVLLTPTTPATARPIGENTLTIDGVEDDFRIVTTRLVRGINLLGFPALSIPGGFDSDDLPVGVQLIGKPWSEKLVLAAGAALQDATTYHHRKPSL